MWLVTSAAQVQDSTQGKELMMAKILEFRIGQLKPHLSQISFPLAVIPLDNLEMTEEGYEIRLIGYRNESQAGSVPHV